MDSPVTPVTLAHLLGSAGLVVIPASRDSLLIQATVERRGHLGVIQVIQAIRAGRGFQVGQASQVKGFLVIVASRVLQAFPVSLDTVGAVHFQATQEPTLERQVSAVIPVQLLVLLAHSR